MTKQAVVYLLILLAGLAGGTGLGYLITQSKLDEANAAVDKLNADIEGLTAQSETDLKAANTKVSRMEAELTKLRNEMMRKNTEMLRAQTDLTKMKKLLDQTLQQRQGVVSAAGSSTSTRTAARQSNTASTATRSSTSSSVPAGAREYTIKEGDSLWKIAATELGNGIRWEEIDQLNPDVDQNTTLKVGMKIKIPTR